MRKMGIRTQFDDAGRAERARRDGTWNAHDPYDWGTANTLLQKALEENIREDGIAFTDNDGEEAVLALAAQYADSQSEGVTLAAIEFLIENPAFSTGHDNGMPGKNRAGSLSFAKQILKKTGERAAMEAELNNEILTPPLLFMFKRMISQSPRADGREVFGPAAAEAFEKFRRWLNKAAIADLEPLSSITISWHREIAGMIVEEAACFSNEDAVSELAEISKIAPWRILLNKHATEKSVRAMADLVIEQVHRSTSPKEVLLKFFIGMHAKGWTLDETQVRRLRIFVSLNAHGRSSDLTKLAWIPEVAMDRRMSEQIIESTNEADPDERPDILSVILLASQGHAWLKTAKTILQTQGFELGRQVALEEATSWNITGLARRDLIFLIQAENAQVRKEGLRLASLLEQQKRATTPPATRKR